jgi:hypothetical protein
MAVQGDNSGNSNTLFSYNSESRRSEMREVAIESLFDDVKLCDGESKGAALENGYLPLVYECIDLGLVYMAKPTSAVVDYMLRSGRGNPCNAEIIQGNAVAFVSDWDGFKTQPRIAGVVSDSDLEGFKKGAERMISGLVNRMYGEFHSKHPNYTHPMLRHPRGEKVGSCMSAAGEVARAAKKVWLAVGYELNDDVIKQKAKDGYFDEFYTDQRNIDFLNENFGLKLNPLRYNSSNDVAQSDYGR